ncbi:efflux RND transporter periplasmic adaptor subunit [bacterium]|nr:efflux RND transporter periplasmic adaptor subunit [bacterium]
MKKFIWIIAIIVVIGIIIVAGISYKAMHKNKKLVDVGKISPRTIKSTVIAFGRIEPKSDVNISAEVSEKIESLYVDEGDTVEIGDTLVILNRDRYIASLNKAQAQVSQVRANLNKAQDNLRKTNELKKSGAVSDDALLSAKTEVDVLEAQLQSAQATLREARDNLAHTIIKAPIDGIVTFVQAEKGEFVVVGTMNNIGSAIMTIAQLTDLQAKVEVDEADIVDLELAQFSKIELDALPDTFFEGRTVQISHQANVQNIGGEETRATFYVYIALVNPSPKIRPGMSVTATITTAEHDSVLAVQLSAVVAYRDTATDRDGEAVFIVDNGIAKKKPIKTGISDDRFVEVTDGISMGESVITGPFKVLRELKEGDKVQSISKNFGKDLKKGEFKKSSKGTNPKKPDGKKSPNPKPTGR